MSKMIQHWRERYPKRKTSGKVILFIVLLLLVIFFITRAGVLVDEFGKLFFDTPESQEEVQE